MARPVLGRRSVLAAVTVATALTAACVSPPMAMASDTLPWEGKSAKGVNQPYQHGYSATTLLDWDPRTDTDAGRLRARIPLQKRAGADPATQRNPDLPAETQNLTLAGDYGNAFFESHPYTNEFSQYLFNYWQYTDAYASWHGMPTEGVPEDSYDPSAEWTQRWFEFGSVNLPNPGYTNAAHRNGARSLGTVFFSDNDRGPQSYSELLVRDKKGGFPAARKLAEVAHYFGFDGYFFNQEQSQVAPEDVDDYMDFLAALRAEGLYVQWYDSVDAGTGKKLYENEFTSRNAPFIQNSERGPLADSIFLNYWWNHKKLTDSAAYATSLGVNPRRQVFAGVEAGTYQFDQPYDLADDLGDDGKPMNAIATLGADFVHSDYKHKTEDDHQSTVFDRERRWWTGTSTGTGSAADGQWKGMSTYIAERTAITGSTFATTFNTGHGLGYWRDGARASDREWGNIGIQDTPVTWQWWLQGAGADGLQVDYDYGPDYVTADRFHYDQIGAYEGGSSLAVSGKLSGDAVLRLYKTDLKVVDGSKVKLTYAEPSGDDADLSLALVLKSDPKKTVRVPIKASKPARGGWRTATVDLSDYAGETVSTLGLGLTPGADPIDHFQLNLGVLALSDGADHTPAAPTGFHIDQALTSTDELNLGWHLDDYKDVVRYDVYADGKYLGGVYDDTFYAKGFTGTHGRLQLVAVGKDGSKSKPATIGYDFTHGPGDVSAKASMEGTVTVSWDEPVSPGAVVTLAAEDEDQAGHRRRIVLHPGRGETSATFRNAPVDGGAFVATVNPTGGGTAVATTGTFADTEIETYPKSAAELSGTSLTLTQPTLADWHTLTVYENDKPIPFDTTYSQGERDRVIRGRTTLEALSVTLTSANSKVTAVLEDYAGNQAETVLREATD
ncbi:endo-beta-N-acetylglucosaminidase [Streptomyces sp. NPDC058297]|uniref:endo-beta-N-acetylglucosaminidase n=1 Tax=Streptomyces sp. NPDC058297 TaxID=3346433 RepID=UPI0036E2B947